MATIGISIGHGGNDSGCIAYNGEFEKDLNLKVGLEVKAILQELGHKIIVSRTTDVDGIETRFAKDINSKVDLAIAIHFNAFNKTVQGTEVGFNGDKSELLSTKINKALVSALTGITNRGLKQSNSTSYNFAMLKQTYPCAYCECLFIDSPSAEQYINSTAKLNKIANAIATGIITYLDEVEELETCTCPYCNGTGRITKANLETFEVGQTVEFKGGTVYLSSMATAGNLSGASKVIITKKATGARNEYHVQNVTGSCVYGWVEKSNLKAVKL